MSSINNIIIYNNNNNNNKLRCDFLRDLGIKNVVKGSKIKLEDVQMNLPILNLDPSEDVKYAQQSQIANPSVCFQCVLYLYEEHDI